MNWFQRHLNWTLILTIIVCSIIANLLAYIGEGYGDTVWWWIVLILMVVFSFTVEIWYLKQKARSLWNMLWNLAGIIGIIVILCLENRSLGLTGSHAFTLSNIYMTTETDKPVNTSHDFQYFQEVLSCPTCAFADQEARQQGKPWCNAPNPPDIKDNYCHTWQRVTEYR